jgi:sortase A
VVDETAAGRPARQRRPNRFDRPPEPHDWRWFIGGVGRTLISIGVLLFAFVAYQLWGTGIQTARAQGQLEREFDDLLATTPTAATSTAPPSVATTVPASTTPPAAGDTTTTTAAPTTTVAALPPAVAPPSGDVLSRLEIPSISLDKIVVEGVNPDDLKKGPGHFPETPLPGQFGNAAIAGHRTTYGEPFFDIDLIQMGDDLVVTAPWGRFVYVVDNITIVGADDYALVIPTVDPTVARITLASCHPKYSAKQRYVVQATLDTARSDQATFPGAPAPPEPAVTATTAPPTVPTVGPQTGSASTVPASTPTTVAPTTSTTTPGGITPGGIGPDEGESGDSGAVVFGSEWFGDDDAYVPVAMWGFRLLVVAFVATAISRFARRNVVGVLVGIVPFVVCLYFFFEDLSRLLPANL